MVIQITNDAVAARIHQNFLYKEVFAAVPTRIIANSAANEFVSKQETVLVGSQTSCILFSKSITDFRKP